MDPLESVGHLTISTASGHIAWICGEGEIRTHDTLTGIPVFETGAFNHSATSPGQLELSGEGRIYKSPAESARLRLKTSSCLHICAFQSQWCQVSVKSTNRYFFAEYEHDFSSALEAIL